MQILKFEPDPKRKQTSLNTTNVDNASSTSVGGLELKRDNALQRSACSASGLWLFSVVLFAQINSLSFAQSATDLIPANRLTTWLPGINVGVPGGIPTNRSSIIDVTQPPYNADRSGSTNSAGAVQAAINAAAPGQVVYLPSGTYRLDSQLNLGSTRSGITLRGAGMNSTILSCRMNNVAIYVGSGSDYQWNYPPSNNFITSGQTKGSTVLSVADTSPFTVGNLINIGVHNLDTDNEIQQGAVPHVSVAGYKQLRRQMSRLIAKSANTLTIFPGLYDSYSGVNVQVYAASSQASSCGIEDLTIDCTPGATQVGVIFEQCYASWLSGVKVTKAANYAFSVTSSLNCEIRKCFANTRATNGSNGGGVLIGMSSGCLVEDNILYKFFPLIEVNAGASGNVFAYNFCYDSTVFGVSGMGIDTNHAPHNFLNLYEGNIASTLQCDGYFGGASDDTIFRNWLHGTNPGITTGANSIVLNRFTRNYNLIGNILGKSGQSEGAVSYGYPNLGNAATSGTAHPTNGDFWDDWKLQATVTSRSSDEAGEITLSSGSVSIFQYVVITWGTNSRRGFMPSSVSGRVVRLTSSTGTPLPPTGSIVTVWTGSSGYQELDLGVEATTVRKGNYNAKDGQIPASESLGGLTLPNSLYLSSKPIWFGDLPWPAFNPSNPNQNFDAIPAGYRFFHDVEVPTASNSAPTTVRIVRTQG